MNLENSRSYYGEILGGSVDLRTDACCTVAASPPEVREALANIHDEVKAHYYGCGLVVPQAIKGAHILDLGSGSGQDSYLLAQLVGEYGRVTLIDATRAQLAIADRHLDWHRDRFGYAQSNVRFVEGDIERLERQEHTAANWPEREATPASNIDDFAQKMGHWLMSASHQLWTLNSSNQGARGLLVGDCRRFEHIASR